jgi:hypothetical protein
VAGTLTKTLLPKVGALPRVSIRVTPLQPENAEFPMEVTLEGIVTLVRLLQLANAEFPMEVTLEGIVTLASLEQA